MLSIFKKLLISSLVVALSGMTSPAWSLDKSKFPKILDKCKVGSGLVVGLAGTTLKVLSCGPDGKLHVQSNQPPVDQSTGKVTNPNVDFTKAPAVPAELSADDGTGNMDFLIKGLKETRDRVSAGSETTLVTYFDARIPQGARTAALKSAKAFMAAYGDLFEGKKKFYVVFTSTRNNAMASYKKIAADESYPALLNEVKQGLKWNTKSPTSQEFIGASGITGSPKDDFSLTTIFYGNSATFDRNRLFIIPGEMKHALFFSLTSGKTIKPCFLTPGNAGTFGAAFSYPGESDESLLYTFARNHGAIDNAEGSPIFTSLDMGSLDGNSLKFLPGSECGVAHDFVVSAPAASYLVGKYGIAKEISYLKAMGANPSNWEQIFTDTYGFTTAAFNTEARNFLIWYKNWYYKKIMKKAVPAK